MAIEGRLSDVGLADICQLLSMGRRTGCLTITQPGNFGYIYLEDGRVVSATILNRPDRLGQLLVRNHIITGEELAEGIRVQGGSPGKRLGQVLIDLGHLSEEDLRRFVTLQVEEAVYDLFSWDDGTFRFDPDRRFESDGAVSLSIPIENLLLEGARRVDELSVIEKDVPSRELIYSVDRSRLDRDRDRADERGRAAGMDREGGPAHVEEGRLPGGSEANSGAAPLTREQERILTLLDGRRTVEEVIEESGLLDFDVLKAIFGLKQAGYLQEAGRREAQGDGDAAGLRQRRKLAEAFERAGMLDDAEREYLGVLELAPSDRQARVRLGLLALRTNRPDEATARLEVSDPEELPSETQARLGNLALALEMQGRYEEALAHLQEAADLAAEEGPDLLLARAIVLFKAGRAREARDAFSRLEGTQTEGSSLPALHFAYSMLASAADGDLDRAIEAGREGLLHYPDCGPIQVNLGVLLERANRPEEAEKMYRRAAAARPPLAHAHRNLGDLAWENGDQSEARACYERALKLDPGMGAALHVRLGELAYVEGDRSWARHHWERALELNPDDPKIEANLALVTAPPSAGMP